MRCAGGRQRPRHAARRVVALRISDADRSVVDASSRYSPAPFTQVGCLLLIPPRPPIFMLVSAGAHEGPHEQGRATMIRKTRVRTAAAAAALATSVAIAVTATGAARADNSF